MQIEIRIKIFDPERSVCLAVGIKTAVCGHLCAAEIKGKEQNTY